MSVRSRLSLQAENAALRNQLSLYRQSRPRPKIRPADRLLWCFIAKFWSGWRALSQPAKAGRPQISPELRKLIRRMWEANPTWGSPKIVAELAMLASTLRSQRWKSTSRSEPGRRHRRGERSWTSMFEISYRSTFSQFQRLGFGCYSSSSCWPTTGGELFTSM